MLFRSLRHAPQASERARKLFATVAGRARSTRPAHVPTAPAAAGDATLQGLDARVAAAEAALADLQGQMLESSEVIKALSEQNTQLIRQVEIQRMRLIRLTVTTIVLAVVVLVSLIWLLQRAR